MNTASAGQVDIEYGVEEGARAECGKCGWESRHPYDLSKVRGDALSHALRGCVERRRLL